MGEELCYICNDKSTGKHYGAVSCDGCKGFFRRSIRKRYHYVCRFDKACDVTKNKRNACRSCRLQKCVMAGMKSNAIQNERDAIGKRKKTPVIDKEELFDQLVAAENLCQQLRSSVIKRTERATYDCRKNIPPEHQKTSSGASLNDVGKSIHQQLVLLVEWAKSLPQFASLSVTDQASLLKGTATSIITLGVAYRTVPLNSADAICLANDRILSQQDAAQFGDMNCVVSRIVQQAVNPIRNLKVDLMEYVALKGILFFNPIVPDIEDRAAIERFRLTLIRTLKKRCAEKAQSALDDDASDCRTSLLLLLLPSLQSLAQQLKEDVQLARIFGLVNVDSLMIELILNDQKSPDDQLLQTSLSSPMESIKAELEV